jgi:hypothetical protein
VYERVWRVCECRVGVEECVRECDKCGECVVGVE